MSLRLKHCTAPLLRQFVLRCTGIAWAPASHLRVMCLCCCIVFACDLPASCVASFFAPCVCVLFRVVVLHQCMVCFPRLVCPCVVFCKCRACFELLALCRCFWFTFLFCIYMMLEFMISIYCGWPGRSPLETRPCEEPRGPTLNSLGRDRNWFVHNMNGWTQVVQVHKAVNH